MNDAKSMVSKYQSANPYTYGRIQQVVGGVLIADGLVGLENPLDGKRTRPGILGSLAGIFIGIAVIGIGIIAPLISTKTDAVTKGIVTSVEERQNDQSKSCRITAKFDAGSKSYSAQSSYSTDLCHYAQGGAADIYYLSSNPTDNSVGPKPELNPFLIIGAGLVLFFISLVRAIIRGLSLFFGIKLWTNGRKLAKGNPPTSGDEGIISEAKQQFTALVSGRSKQSGLFGLFNRNQLLQGITGGTNTVTPSTTTAVQPVVAPPVSTVQPGWYATQDGKSLRWHDGTRWTDNVRPIEDNKPPIV